MTIERSARLAVLVGVLCVAAWWVWPSWNGSDDNLDVALISDEGLAAGDVAIIRNLRADGRTATYGGTALDWCAASPVVAAAVDELEPSTVVLSFARLGACGADGVSAAVAAAGDRRVVVVLQPGDAHDVAVPGAAVLDPARLVGADAAPTRMPCQWWDVCDGSGFIDVRGPDGQLTDAGIDRVARLLAVDV